MVTAQYRAIDEQQQQTRAKVFARVRQCLLQGKQEFTAEGGLSPCRDIEEVVVVATSSRSGSSYFMELLRHCPELYYFRGEMVPFMRVAGLLFPDNASGSDFIENPDVAGNGADPAGHSGSLLLEKLIPGEIGQGFDPQQLAGANLAGSFLDRARFARDLYLRLVMQWPMETFDREHVILWLDTIIARFSDGSDAAVTSLLQGGLFHLHFYALVRGVHAAVNPYYYDIQPELIRQYYPDIPVPKGPPSGVLIEEPPFITLKPREINTRQTLKDRPGKRGRTLIIKAPAHAYQLHYLRWFFSGIRFRLIHLTRNPAASINGLYDGWLHRGFFVQAMPVELNIRGYSDRFPQWGKRWWNFDLPPGWQTHITSPLEAVCAFQWASAHRYIQQFIQQSNIPVLPVRYEDLIGSEQQRRVALLQVCHWLGVDESTAQALSNIELAPVMATQKPGLHRWKERAALIKPLLASTSIRDLANALGY